jgi:outer membrane protein OmpA-like peptidoglycan-associated protein
MAVLWLLALPAAAAAQEAATVAEAARPAGHASPWALGLVGAGGAMLTDDQRNDLQFGGGGGFVRVELRARPFDELGVDWLETELRGSFLVVGPGELGNVGGVLDFSLGVRIAPRVGDVRPYGAVGFGVALTGLLARPVGTGTIGLAFALGDEVLLGPEIDVQHVIQWDGPGASSDAVFLAVAAAFTYRPVSHPAPPLPEVRIEERTTVVLQPPPPAEIAFEPAPPAEPTRMDELMFLMDGAVCGTGVEVVTLLPPVLFDHDRSELTAAGEVAMHDVLARVTEAPDGARIVVEGHADVTGTSDYNEQLALARAHTVASWLAAHGVARESLRETGQGARRPLVDGETTDALAPNRRVTIRIEHDGATVSP